jgi:hypothetical protein
VAIVLIIGASRRIGLESVKAALRAGVFLKPTKSRSAAAARSLPGSHTKSMKNAGAGTR